MRRRFLLARAFCVSPTFLVPALAFLLSPVIPPAAQKFLARQFKTYVLTKVTRGDDGKLLVSDEDVELFVADG
jgi:hypothetical protein